MRVLDSITKMLVVGVPVALIVGCDLPTGTNQTPPPGGGTNWEQSTNLNTEFGGYTFTDESNAFGDPKVVEVENMETSLPVADADSVPNDSTLVLRILWGRLQASADSTTEVDWTGSVSVSRGAIAVLRTIAFDGRRDHLVLPRENRQTVSFVSHTKPSFDGLLLRVHDAPGEPPTTLRFATAAFTQEWNLADLRDANLIIPVGDGGNAVSITGLTRVPRACPSGFVRGVWAQRAGDNGVLFGVWMAENTAMLGDLRGHFGINAAGEHVWFAKILGRGGRLLGLARGTWAPNTDPTQPGGQFRGDWMARPGMLAGHIEGHYLPGRVGDAAAAGFFEARWQAECTGSGAAQ